MTRIDELLNDWRIWVLRGNMPALGFAMSAYAERVGNGAWASPEPDDTEDVVRLNELITTKLPKSMVMVIWTHYVVPGPVKSKIAGMNKNQYYGRLEAAKTVLSELWDEVSDKV